VSGSDGPAGRLRIQLWSFHYEPEPMGIGPIAAVLARELAARGHSVEVVAAHPHYPEPRWGIRKRPYRERRNGIAVTRVPLWPGREALGQRLRQEATFTPSLAATAPLLGRPDVAVVVSPSFPGLLPAMMNARARRVPWVLWLQDILPDGAAVTGLMDSDRLAMRLARRLERAAYRSAAKIVVISDTFRRNLESKGVPPDRIATLLNPASAPLQPAPRDPSSIDHRLTLSMGNIGHSQNLEAVVGALESSDELEEIGARLCVVGDGVRAGEVRAAISTGRTEALGVVDRSRLESLLGRTALGLVTQKPRDNDFNVPSKLMNFMGAGVPVMASVDADSEVAHIIRRSGGGWVTDSARLEQELAPTLAAALADPEERERRGAAGLAFAREQFGPDKFATRFEAVLRKAVP